MLVIIRRDGGFESGNLDGSPVPSPAFHVEIFPFSIFFQSRPCPPPSCRKKQRHHRSPTSKHRNVQTVRPMVAQRPTSRSQARVRPTLRQRHSLEAPKRIEAPLRHYTHRAAASETARHSPTRSGHGSAPVHTVGRLGPASRARVSLNLHLSVLPQRTVPGALLSPTDSSPLGYLLLLPNLSLPGLVGALAGRILFAVGVEEEDQSLYIAVHFHFHILSRPHRGAAGDGRSRSSCWTCALVFHRLHWTGGRRCDVRSQLSGVVKIICDYCGFAGKKLIVSIEKQSPVNELNYKINIIEQMTAKTVLYTQSSTHYSV